MAVQREASAARPADVGSSAATTLLAGSIVYACQRLQLAAKYTSRARRQPGRCESVAASLARPESCPPFVMRSQTKTDAQTVSPSGCLGGGW